MKIICFSNFDVTIFQSSTALAAVALQDHMTRSLSLQDPFKKKKINHSLPAVAARSKKTNKAVGKAKESHDKKEYVLDPTPASLTLGMFNWIIATFVMYWATKIKFSY